MKFKNPNPSIEILAWPVYWILLYYDLYIIAQRPFLQYNQKRIKDWLSVVYPIFTITTLVAITMFILGMYFIPSSLIVMIIGCSWMIGMIIRRATYSRVDDVYTFLINATQSLLCGVFWGFGLTLVLQYLLQAANLF
jgi:hypothetical protein